MSPHRGRAPHAWPAPKKVKILPTTAARPAPLKLYFKFYFGRWPNLRTAAPIRARVVTCSVPQLWAGITKLGNRLAAAIIMWTHPLIHSPTYTCPPSSSPPAYLYPWCAEWAVCSVARLDAVSGPRLVLQVGPPPPPPPPISLPAPRPPRPAPALTIMGKLRHAAPLLPPPSPFPCFPPGAAAAAAWRHRAASVAAAGARSGAEAAAEAGPEQEPRTI